MRSGRRLAAVAAGVLAMAALTPAAWGQRRNLVVNTSRDPASGITRVSIATGAPVAVQTSVAVPDGGSALAARFNQASEARSEYGAPVLGKVPYLGRGFRNVGYGRSLGTRRVGVSVRVIDLREEEFRQTGFRSP